MRGNLRGLLAAAALGVAAASGASPAGLGLGAPSSTVQAPSGKHERQRRNTRSPTSNDVSRYPNGPGWTQAQVQRMARKKRNQARNRRAHRGLR